MVSLEYVADSYILVDLTFTLSIQASATYNDAKGSMLLLRVVCVLLFFQWYYDGAKAACDGAITGMWLMMVTRVLRWSKVHNDSAKGPMMMTRPYNTLPTIIKNLHGTILGPCNNHRALNTIIGPPTPS